MTQETTSEFSLQLRRGARRIHVVAAARGAPAMVLAIAHLVVAVALVVHGLRAPVSTMGHGSVPPRTALPMAPVSVIAISELRSQRAVPPRGALPMTVSGLAASRVVWTPLPTGASLVRMHRPPLEPAPISTASESSRTVVS